MNTKQPVRVRFAPSPTGHLHIGGVRTALFNWLFARHNEGTYLLRIEDTDVQRSTKEYLDSQLASLTWLGLLPDEEMVFQRDRAPGHVKHAYELMDRGLAYPCFCPPRDMDEVVQAHEQGIVNKYAGICRDNAFTQEDLKKPHAIRFKLPAVGKEISFDDIIRGKINVSTETLDDFIIVRRDGLPMYNFCVVVDDIFMNITHIIRGEDHISNTIKQVLLYQALGSQMPAFAHLPLILGKSGGKLSKRDAAVSVEHYRAQGFLGDALCNYLVRLGWSHGDQELFTRHELVEKFTLEAVGKKGSIFDMKKLEWLNAMYMRQLSFSQIMQALEQMNPATVSQLQVTWSEKQLESLVKLYGQRAITLVQLHHDIMSFAHDPQELDLALIEKWRTPQTALLLQEFLAYVQTGEITHAALLDAAQKICDTHQEKLVNVAQALRLALTGSIQSPGVFDLIEVLGNQRASIRISLLLARL
ncbi:glutamate--tRNA ligase [Candidatus Babeliales bacterium]|nr:glutamate--tRNA ligase [Candidatus Babeliales bacterium]